MTNDFGYATVNANYHVFNYGNIESNPGNSGGPLWYASASGPYVVGVASTSSWAAHVGLAYSQIVTWIQGNDNLIPAASSVAVSSPNYSWEQERLAVQARRISRVDGGGCCGTLATRW